VDYPVDRKAPEQVVQALGTLVVISEALLYIYETAEKRGAG
jgi:hypothetical protein